MKLFGLEITRQKALHRADTGPWHRINEPFAGAWQMNQELTTEDQLSHYAVFSCVTLIASDIAKLDPQLMRRQKGVWQSVDDNQRIDILLRNPNNYQTWNQLAEAWTLSKLLHGNAYALKERGPRGGVFGLHVLNPARVTPLVSDSGDVFYRLGKDPLAQVTADDTVVPAREIIHDRMNCFYHPLIGQSPLHAATVAAGHGLNIQNQSAAFFKNGARPSGLLSAPGAISDDTAKRLKDHWETKFSGDDSGRVAVLGDGLKYEPMTMTAEAAQLIDQLKMSAEAVCSAFRVPAFKVGVGTTPTYSNGELFNQTYFSDCLQSLIEQFEKALAAGLGLGDREAIKFDLDGLLRTDSKTRIENLSSAVNGSIMSTNEARARMDLPPVEGGDTLWRQQQDHSLQALANRDATLAPFSGEPEPAPPTESPEEEARTVAALVAKELMTDG